MTEQDVFKNSMEFETERLERSQLAAVLARKNSTQAHASFRMGSTMENNCNFIKFKHFWINISDIKIERRFDDSMSSLSNSKYMIELIEYIVVVVWKYVRNWKGY